MTIFALLGAIESGLIFSLVALGVYLSFRVLDFPDLTVDGSFPLGAAVSSVSIVSGLNPFLATMVGAACGFVAGYATAKLHLKLKILNLLASILVMLALYSINLRIMGRPNVPLLAADTVFTPLKALPIAAWVVVPVVMGMLVILAKLLLDWFLSTDFGLALRAVGSNERMAAAQGISRDHFLPLGLGLSNALVALAGSLFAQSQGFADVGMGTGVIIIGLAAVIVGETLVSSRTVFFATLGCIVGALVYRIVISFALNLDAIGLQAQDLNLVTTVLVITAIALTRIKGKGVRKKGTRGTGLNTAENSHA